MSWLHSRFQAMVQAFWNNKKKETSLVCRFWLRQQVSLPIDLVMGETPQWTRRLVGHLPINQVVAGEALAVKVSLQSLMKILNQLHQTVCRKIELPSILHG